MPQEEIHNSRDRTYSAWHRRQSTRRFIGIESAQVLAMIDLDASLYVEYDDGTKEPLALIETAMDVGQAYKCCTVTRNLARRCNPIVPAYVLLYRKSDNPNPADPRYADIASFRFKCVWPQETEWKIVTPVQWAKNLVDLRKWCARKVDQAAGIKL
jgi:hypothetical protein